jgi:hypothetical protein
VGESLDLSLLATPGEIKANKERAGLYQTLGLYPATKYSGKSQKTAILRAEFWVCPGSLSSQNYP